MFTKMEQPFYHDESFISAYSHSDTSLHDFKIHKQHMGLNSAEPYRNLKSQLRVETDFYQAASQDVGSLKLASPELERLIIQNSNGCRRRKLERIARLEDKVKVLKSDNAGLSSTASVLREQVAQLKQKVMTHVSSGCQLMLTSKMESF
ncbi:Transcription factor jun-B-like [Scleropages formosus]|uniref:Transcription factor JunB n=1 Tax=Scleropages formosus TaxID=113540 RepID=A0A0P7TRR2_SCLFO|nr:Transcription factor jun-B-like [Scleropages formosus]